ncbi:MAG: GNAT family N-acetyltransferase [Alphaproteobacteria bacterium]
MKIRKATTNDLVKIQELNNKLFELELANYDKDLKPNWPFSSAGKSYFEDLILNNIVYVAEHNGDVIGYIAGRVNEEESYALKRFTELENMYVEDFAQGNGVGTLLIDEFKKECENKKAASIKVTASYTNEKAISFYKKHLFNNKDLTLLCELN